MILKMRLFVATNEGEDGITIFFDASVTDAGDEAKFFFGGRTFFRKGGDDFIIKDAEGRKRATRGFFFDPSTERGGEGLSGLCGGGVSRVRRRNEVGGDEPLFNEVIAHRGYSHCGEATFDFKRSEVGEEGVA